MDEYAQKHKKIEFRGIWSAVQIGVLVLPIVFYFLAGIFGVIVGVALVAFFWGTGFGFPIQWFCGKCGKKLPDKNSETCPFCKVSFFVNQ